MFIKAIYVKNIQSWKESTVYFTNKLNIIKGRNDVGKTALQLSLRIFTDTLSNDKLKSAMTYGETESEVKLYLSNRTILQALLKCEINTKGKRERFKIQYNILNWQENKILKQWDGSSPEIPQYLGLLSTSNTCINLTELERKIFVNTDHKENTEIVNLFTSLPFVDEKISYLKSKQARIEDIQKKTEIAVDFYKSKIQQPTKPIWQLKSYLDELKAIKEYLVLCNKMRDYILLIKTIKTMNEYLQVIYVELYTICKLKHRMYSKNLQLINYTLKINNERGIINNTIIYSRLHQDIKRFNEISNLRYLNKLATSYSIDIISKNNIGNRLLSLTNMIDKLSHLKLQENSISILKHYIEVYNNIRKESLNKANLDSLHSSLYMYKKLDTLRQYITYIQSLDVLKKKLETIDKSKMVYNDFIYISLLKCYTNIVEETKTKSLLENNIKLTLRQIEMLKENNFMIGNIRSIINYHLDKYQLQRNLKIIDEKINSIPKCPTCNRPF